MGHTTGSPTTMHHSSRFLLRTLAGIGTCHGAGCANTATMFGMTITGIACVGAFLVIRGSMGLVRVVGFKLKLVGLA